MIFIVKILIWLLVSTSVIFVLAKYTNVWAHRLQNYYVRKGNESRVYGWAVPVWRSKFYFFLSKFIIIFFGVMIILVAFNVLFGTIYINEISRQPENATTSNPLTVPRGDRVGYISKAYEIGGKYYVDFREIQFFYGKAAQAAIRKDGKCYVQPGDTECFVPDGYYVRNMNTSTSTLEVASNSKIMVWSDCYDINQNGISISLGQFVKYYGSDTCARHLQPAFYLRNDTPYWINQNASGQVTLIWEQYVP